YSCNSKRLLSEREPLLPAHYLLECPADSESFRLRAFLSPTGYPEQEEGLSIPPHLPPLLCGGALYRKIQNFVHTITVAVRNDAAGARRTLLDLGQSGRKSAHE